MRKGGQYQKTYFWAHCFQGFRETVLHAIHTACGIETFFSCPLLLVVFHCMQSIPLAVLKLFTILMTKTTEADCMQSIPLAVLKRRRHLSLHQICQLHAIHTACGIETLWRRSSFLIISKLHAIHTACGIETFQPLINIFLILSLHAIHTACGIETSMRPTSFQFTDGIACNPYRLRY